MATFNHKNRNIFSIGPHLLGLLFIGAGLFALASPFIIKSATSTERAVAVGGGALLLGLLILTTYSGTLIDFAGKRSKEYTTVAGIRMGQWTQLPEIKKVKLSEEVQRVTNTPNGISPTFSGNVTVYQVMLYDSHDRPVHTFSCRDSTRSRREAEALSKNLNVVLEQNSMTVKG